VISTVHETLTRLGKPLEEHSERCRFAKVRPSEITPAWNAVLGRNVEAMLMVDCVEKLGVARVRGR